MSCEVYNIIGFKTYDVFINTCLDGVPDIALRSLKVKIDTGK